MILVGGLEAGIALHILNNLLAFGVAIAFAHLQSALTVSEVSWWQLPLTVTQNGVFLVLVLLVARRMGLRNKTAPARRQQVAATPVAVRGHTTSIGGRGRVCVSLTLGSPGRPHGQQGGPIPWGMG